MRIAWPRTDLTGRPMTERLLPAGHAVTVWNQTLGRDAQAMT